MLSLVYTLLTFSRIVSSQSVDRLSELFWPQSWVTSQIELSTNHLSTYTSITLYLHTSLNISESFASITLPQLTPTYYCSISEYNQIDYKIHCQSLSLGSGLYGPINLQIKSSATGKLLAHAPNFGTFYILPPEPEAQPLSISIESDAFQVNSPFTLSFNTTMTKPVYRNDYLVLKIDEKFPYTPSGISWRFDYNGSFNFLTTKWLYEEDSRELFIYGIAQDIVPVISIGFDLTGFTGPSSVVSDFYWEMGIYRFGVETLIEKFSGSGPSLALSQGEVEILDWKFVHPHLDASDSTIGLVTYTELSFVVPNKVPISGWINIGYTGVDICSYTPENKGNQSLTQTTDFEDCGVFANSTSEGTVLDCKAETDKKLTCTVKGSALIGGSTVFVYNLIEVTGISEVNSISTFDSFGRGIDNTNKTVEIVTGVNSFIDVNVVSFVYSENNASYVNGAGAAGYFGLVVEFVTTQALQPGDNITVYLPITKKTSFTEHFVGIGQHFYAKYAVTDGVPYSETTSFTTFSDFSVSEGSITVRIIEQIEEKSTFIVYIGCEDGEGAVSGMFMPLVPNDISFLFQIVLKVLTSNTNFVYSAPFYVSGYSLNTWFTPFCRDVWVDGLPIEVFLQMDCYLRSHVYEFFAVYEFDDLDTGMVSGEPYPSRPTGAEFFEPSGIKYHFESFKQGISESFVIPFYKLSAKVHRMKCSLYYVDKEGISKIMGVGEFLYDLSGITEKTQEDGDELNEYALQDTVDLDFEIDPVDEETYNIAVLGDFGFEFTSLIGNSILKTDYLASEQLSYSAVLFTDKLTTSKSNGKYSVRIKNIWFAVDEYYVYFVYTAGQDFVNGSCTGFVKSTINNENPLDLVLMSYRPDEISAYSFGSEAMNIELIFHFKGTIKKGSYITITQSGISLDSVAETDWQVSSESTKLTGSYSSYWKSLKTLTPLSSFLKIKVKNVKKPIIYSTSKMILLSRVVVYSEHGEKSYEWVQKESEALCTFNPGNTKTASSGVKQLSVFPNSIGSNLVRFFVSFKPQNDIPKGSTVYIDAHFDDSVVRDNVWCNFNFRDPKIDDGVLSIVLEEGVKVDDLVELVKEEAFNISLKMSRTVSVWAKKDLFTIIEDDYEKVINQRFSIIKTPIYEITKLSQSVSLTTPGYESLHYFEFYVNKKTRKEWTYILDFSQVYNSNIGPYQTFFYLPNLKYLSASDSNGQKLLCPVKNWMVFCNLQKTYSPNSKITLTLPVLNPYQDGLVSLYILNEEDTLISSPNSNILFQYSSNPPKTIDIQHVVHDCEDKFELNCFLTLQVFADIQTKENDVLKLVLPIPYDLGFYNITWFNCSIWDLSKTSVVMDDYCEVTGNTVAFTFSQGHLFKGSEFTNVTLRNLYKPETGYTRDLWTFESSDNVYWTNKFRVFIERDSKVLAQSIENLHSGFTGFNSSGYTRVQVNSGKTLKLSPGAFFGDFLISAGKPFKSGTVRVLARFDKDSGIVLSEGGEYELSVKKPFVYFSIAVEESTKEGFYRIYWDIDETPLIDYEYLPPLPSVVKVVKMKGLLQMEVEPGFSVIQGVVSQPLYIRTQDYGRYAVYPFEELQIRLEVSNANNDLDFQFFPNPVNFSSLASNASFSILCNNCSTDLEYEINATVVSNDSMFYFPEQANFYVQPRPTFKSECKLDLTKLNPSTLKVSVTTNSPSRVVWALISDQLLDSDPALIKKSSILSNSYDYAAPNNSLLSIQDQFTLYSEHLESLLNKSGFSYQDFTFNAIFHSKSTYLTSVSKIPKGTSHLFTFSKLLPSHTYFIQAFIDNFSGFQDSICSSYVTTDNYQPFGKLVFTSSESFEPTYLLKQLSLIYQVDSYLFIPLSTNLRSLLESSSYLVYPSITEGTSGYHLASSVSEASLLAELQALGIIQVGVSELDPLDYERMYWEKSLKTEWKYEEDLMTFNFIVSTSGTLYCIVQEPSSLNETMTKEGILAGRCWNEDRCWVSRSSVKAGSQEWVFNATENQLEYGQYTIDCLACNSYPLTPSCTSIKNTTVEHITTELSLGYLLFPILAYFLVLI